MLGKVRAKVGEHTPGLTCYERAGRYATINPRCLYDIRGCWIISQYDMTSSGISMLAVYDGLVIGSTTGGGNSTLGLLANEILNIVYTTLRNKRLRKRNSNRLLKLFLWEHGAKVEILQRNIQGVLNFGSYVDDVGLKCGKKRQGGSRKCQGAKS